ncbi:MAG: GspH/FimT family pseudopilin [Thermosynechococcaceae cyanobacterium]
MRFARLCYPKHDAQGFTLIEMLISIMVTGILAAIAAPSFLSWVNSKRVDDALALMEGAIKESQSVAIKKSQPCTVDIGPTITAVVTGTTNSCLSTGPRDLTKLGIKTLAPGANDTGVSIAFSGGDNKVVFSPKGSTTTDKTIVVYRTDGSGKMRCLVVSSGLGLLRVGNYTGANPPGTPVESSCVTTS